MSSRRLTFFATILAVALCLHSRAQSDANTPPPSDHAVPRNLGDFLLPAVKNGGFAMDGYILWCSSVIKVGDTYHMFASRWPLQYGLNGWTKYSECVRATSTNLFGHYTFQEVVL